MLLVAGEHDRAVSSGGRGAVEVALQVTVYPMMDEVPGAAVSEDL